MSEILGRAQEFRAKKAAEQTDKDELTATQEKELLEARQLGAGRAIDFRDIMLQNQIQTEAFYTESYSKQTRFRDSVRVYTKRGNGWIATVKEVSSSNGIWGTTTDYVYVAVLDDGEVYSCSTMNGRYVLGENNSPERLATPDSLDLLGERIVALGI